MPNDDQSNAFSPVTDLDLVRWLLADIHDDLHGKIARFRQLTDLSSILGSGGAMITGGETTWNAWNEARISYIHGNYIATVMVCQGLAEHLLASHLALGNERLPDRISFSETIVRCTDCGVINRDDARDLRRLMELRNPLSHFRSIDDPSNLSRRALDTMQPALSHLFADATFAISMAVRLLALPSFRLGK